MKIITPITDSIFKKLNEEELLLINELYLDMVKYKNVIDKALYWLSENTHYTSLKVDELVLDENANLKELLKLLEEVE